MMIVKELLVVVVLRSPIHANEPSEYNGMLYRTSNRVLNNGIKVIILICMDGTSQYHHHRAIRHNNYCAVVVGWSTLLITRYCSMEEIYSMDGSSKNKHIGRMGNHS